MQLEKLCLYCQSVLHGRMDKKFCDANCRSLYHNSNLNRDQADIKRINSILRRNRSLLKFFSPRGKTTIRRHIIADKGFNFKYFTHVFTSRNQMTYYICYDYGYAYLDGNKMLIVHQQTYMED
ncbi:MAG: hypothetical protein JEZ03_16895 [Bacteroidales bacterium]|nr:hypothetical protein [Bacteroidales bacterium]